MRTMMKISIPAASGNKAIQDGSLPRIVQNSGAQPGRMQGAAKRRILEVFKRAARLPAPFPDSLARGRVLDSDQHLSIC
jgi:hypothetical protein